MIDTLTLRNFKAHRETVLELKQFTVLVGDNASGKTSVLESLAPDSWLGRSEDFIRRGSDELAAIVTGTRPSAIKVGRGRRNAANYFEGMVYRFEADRIAVASYSPNPKQVLGADGSN